MLNYQRVTDKTIFFLGGTPCSDQLVGDDPKKTTPRWFINPIYIYIYIIIHSCIHVCIYIDIYIYFMRFINPLITGGGAPPCRNSEKCKGEILSEDILWPNQFLTQLLQVISWDSMIEISRWGFLHIFAPYPTWSYDFRCISSVSIWGPISHVVLHIGGSWSKSSQCW
jgi:hypothetical protein